MQKIVNDSGWFFRSQLEKGIFNTNTLRLDEKIDLDCLEKAWRAALSECPFFEQGLVEEDGQLLFAPHRSDCTVERIPDDPLALGSASRAGDLAWVRAEDDRLQIGVSHALTDEFGKKVFSTLLLYHYFCLFDGKTYPHPYQDIVWDTASSPLNEPLFSSAEEPFGFHFPQEPFSFPEAGKNESPRTFCVSVNAKQFLAAVRSAFPLSDEEYQEANNLALPIGRLQCVFVYLLFQTVIKKRFPELDRPITARCPINLRSLCGKEHALRNFSLPQAVVWTTGDIRDTVCNLRKQLSPEAIGWQLGALKEWMNSGEFDPKVRSLYLQSMIVSNVGKEHYEPASGRILADDRRLYGGYSFAVYLNRVGEEQIITILQGFETDVYYRGFLEELKKYGITEIRG